MAQEGCNCWECARERGEHTPTPEYIANLKAMMKKVAA